MVLRSLFAFALALLLAGCAKPVPTKKYELNGVVLSINTSDHTATIKHGKIGDWMEAMTMEYPVKNSQEFKDLTVGEHITATVNVADSVYWIDAIRRVPDSTQAAAPTATTK